jgi:PAS domain S-box-containing protein
MAQDMSEVLTPEHLQSFAEGLPRLIAEFEAGGGVPLSRTDRVDQPCRDGSIVHTEAVTTLLPGNDGRAGEVLGVSRNITERIKAEEALISSEARLRNLLDESPYPLVVTDLPRGVVLFINQPGADLFEVDKQAVIGSETGPFYGKAGLRDLMVAILRRDGAIKDRELVMSTSKGRLFHAQVSVNVSQYEGQEAALISVTDITARKRAEEALRQSEEKFSGAFQTSPYAITITRPRDGKFIEVNDTFAGMTGYTREEALADSSIGLNLWVDEEDRSRVVSELQKGLPVNGREVRFRKKDGAILTCLFSAQVMHLDGEPCILSSINDITERKKAEVEKNRLTDQLQQAMKMEAVGRLAGGVAHDFNNLLTGITGNISVALMDLKPDDPLAETLADVNKAADSAASLTRQLLAFSRKQIIEPKVLNLNELVTNLHKMLIRLIGENIELKTLPAANLASVKADPAQVEQIVINLAVNARDAMPHGGALVIETANVELDAEYCRTHADVRPGKYVMLAVSDTGEGMSKEVKEHLFEPFFTTKPRGHGTGLGLATIYGAIKQSGGSIEVYSEAGKGTTFKVYLPMVVEKAEAAGRQRGISELPGGTETVLVVEDEEMVRQFAVKILSRLGYKVLHAPNGQTALQLAKGFKDRIDLLMTDVVMPGMNGRQLAEKLIILHPETTMLFTSGYTENIIVHQGVVEESLNFIGKPYSPQSIAKKIREVLDKKGQ